jgi:sugar phosphate isomerase/epimerase
VEIVGLHWLFVSPKGLHLTTPDDEVRAKTADYLKSLVHFCGDLGGTVMTLGSPQQRNIEPPNTFEDGWKRARDLLASVAPTCAERNVIICFEALAPAETNFIQTAEEAAKLADEIGHPNINIMLDMKAMSSMPDGPVGTIRTLGHRAKHVHANHPSGKGAGMPLGPDDGEDLDYAAISSALKNAGYNRWVSLEPFDYTPDPKTVAETGLKTLEDAMAG